MKKILLIVEDEKSLSDALQLKLSDLDIQIVVKNDVTSARASISEHLPNLIILDVILPGGENGFDLLEELKQNKITSDVPIIVLTNLDSEKEVSEKIGANEYLVKSDTTLENIKEKIIKYLG